MTYTYRQLHTDYGSPRTPRVCIFCDIERPRELKPPGFRTYWYTAIINKITAMCTKHNISILHRDIVHALALLQSAAH